MPLRMLLRAAVLFLTPCLPGAVLAADEPLSAVESDAGIGLELATLVRSYEVGGVQVDGRGPVGGVHGYVQWGPGFRAEGRLLTGSVDHERPDPDSTSSVVLGEARATLGTATERDVRLYAGFGARQLLADSPFGSGDTSSWLAYLPFGAASAGQLRPGWRALVTIEGRFVLAGRDEIDDVLGIGDASFDRAGGWGAAVSVQFRNAAAGVGIEPFLRYLRPADSERETVGASSVRLADADGGTAGLRLTWAF